MKSSFKIYLKIVLEWLFVFGTISLLIYNGIKDWAIVVAVLVTAIQILYIVFSVTVLPTLKKTVPMFFGNFVHLNKAIVIRIVLLVCVTWLPFLLEVLL